MENLVNGWFKVWVVAVLLFGTVACDSSDGEGNLSLAAPAIGQSEERSTEPVLLAFGWSAVEDAAEYAYRLDEVVGEELHPLLLGKTAATSVELGGERGRTLSLGTTYRFSVQALPAEGVTLSASAFASVDITTSEAPIALTSRTSPIARRGCGSSPRTERCSISSHRFPSRSIWPTTPTWPSSRGMISATTRR